jgi:hypothetical protein
MRFEPPHTPLSGALTASDEERHRVRGIRFHFHSLWIVKKR